MGKRNRRSRAEILAKRAITDDLASRRAITYRVLGSNPLADYSEDVQRLVATLEEIDDRLTDRGWLYEAELSEYDCSFWCYRPQDDGPEVGFGISHIDEDDQGNEVILGAEEMVVETEHLSADGDELSHREKISLTGLWGQLDELEGLVDPAPR